MIVWLVQKTLLISKLRILRRPESLRTFKFIRDSNAFELLADETRRRVIYLLRAKEMTVSQIAAELQKTPQAIYHHIKKLTEAQLVEVGKEERLGHFIETYYRATAEVFEFVHGDCDQEEYGEQRTREALQSLKQLGIDARVDDEIVSRLQGLSKHMDGLALTPELEEKIQSLEGLDFVGRKHLAEYVNLLAMSDQQFEEWLGFERTRRNLVKSAVSGPLQALVQTPKHN